MRFLVVLSLAIATCHASDKPNCMKQVGTDSIKQLANQANNKFDAIEEFVKQRGASSELQDVINGMRVDFNILRESLEFEFKNLKVSASAIISFTTNVGSSAYTFARNNAKHLPQLSNKIINKDLGKFISDIAKEMANDVTSTISTITTGVKDCLKK